MIDRKAASVQQVSSGAATDGAGWSRRLQRLLWPATEAAVSGSSGILSSQVWIDASLWRPAGAWGVLAGVLATGLLAQSDGLDAKTVLLVLLLADPLWGGLWRMAGGRGALLALPGRAEAQRIWLPYLQADSPAARLLGGDNTGIWPLAMRAGLPLLLLSIAVAAVLGLPALLLTGAVTGLAGLGWTMRRTFGRLPALPASIVATALPWLLAVLVLAPGAVNWPAQLMLVALWTVHHWGGARASASGQDWLALALMAMAEMAICLLLIVLQAPLWLALLAVFFLPTWLLVVRQQPLARVRVLWLAAMLISALALGQAAG